MCFIKHYYFRVQWYEAVKQAYHKHFSDAAVSNVSAIFDLSFNGTVIRRISRNMLKQD
jgi:hypothetical protein